MGAGKKSSPQAIPQASAPAKRGGFRGGIKPAAPEGWNVPPPPPDGVGVPREHPVDPQKSPLIQQVLAGAQVAPPLSEKITAGKRAGRARLAQELSGDLSGDLEDALEEDGEIGDETDPDDPEAEDAELAGLDNREDPDSPDLPDLEEILSAEHRGRRGGSVSQPRSASLLPPDLRPRVVERVIRDPQVAARLLARAAKNGHGLVDRGEEIFRNPPEANKGAWGHQQDQQQDWVEQARDAQGAARALPGARGLELSDRQRRGLEGLLDRPLTSGADLVQAVAGLTTNSIAGIAISLTGAERDEVARRAAYNRRTPEQEFAAAWEMIKPLVFNAMRALAGTVEISGKER